MTARKPLALWIGMLVVGAPIPAPDDYPRWREIVFANAAPNSLHALEVGPVYWWLRFG